MRAFWVSQLPGGLTAMGWLRYTKYTLQILRGIPIYLMRAEEENLTQW